MAAYLWPDFVDISGSVFVARAVPRRGVDFRQFHDRTEAESFINHIHVRDLLMEDRLRVRRSQKLWHACTLLVARSLAELWACKLAREFPRRSFRVYLTEDDEPIVRFHRLWPKEIPWLGAVFARKKPTSAAVLAVSGGKVERASSGDATWRAAYGPPITQS